MLLHYWFNERDSADNFIAYGDTVARLYHTSEIKSPQVAVSHNVFPANFALTAQSRLRSFWVHNCDAGNNHFFISFSAVQIYDRSHIHLYLHRFYYQYIHYYDLTTWPSPRWLDRPVSRALNKYRRGHGYESRLRLNLFFRLF